MRLENKVAVILGGGSETALILEKLLLKEGAKLILIDSSLDDFKNALTVLEEWRDNIRIYAADVHSQTEIDHAIQYAVNEFKAVDIMVNCAAMPNTGGSANEDLKMAR